MTTPLRDYRAPIADCLQHCATAVRAIDGGGWEFTPRSEVSRLVTARLKEGWLRLSAELGAQSSSRPTAEILDQMLAHNANLAGGAKFTLADDPPLPWLAAEILLDEEPADLAAEESRGRATASVKRRRSSPVDSI